MAEKDFIQDGLTNEAIIIEIKKIIIRKDESDFKGMNEMEKYKKLQSEFEFFSDRYPMLFDMATRNEEFDWDALNYFLTMRLRIINNRMTSEEASQKVGKEWFDKFVDVNELNKNKNAKRQKK